MLLSLSSRYRIMRMTLRTDNPLETPSVSIPKTMQEYYIKKTNILLFTDHKLSKCITLQNGIQNETIRVPYSHPWSTIIVRESNWRWRRDIRAEALLGGLSFRRRRTGEHKMLTHLKYQFSRSAPKLPRKIFDNTNSNDVLSFRHNFDSFNSFVVKDRDAISNIRVQPVMIFIAKRSSSCAGNSANYCQTSTIDHYTHMNLCKDQVLTCSIALWIVHF